MITVVTRLIISVKFFNKHILPIFVSFTLIFTFFISFFTFNSSAVGGVSNFEASSLSEAFPFDSGLWKAKFYEESNLSFDYMLNHPSTYKNATGKSYYATDGYFDPADYSVQPSLILERHYVNAGDPSWVYYDGVYSTFVDSGPFVPSINYSLSEYWVFDFTLCFQYEIRSGSPINQFQLDDLRVGFGEDLPSFMPVDYQDVISPHYWHFGYAHYHFRVKKDYLMNDPWHMYFAFYGQDMFTLIVMSLKPDTVFSIRLESDADAIAGSIADIGAGISQPDFNGTQGKVSDITYQMNDVEGQFEVDDNDKIQVLSNAESLFSSQELLSAGVKLRSFFDDFMDISPAFRLTFFGLLTLSFAVFVIGRRTS